MPLSVSFFLVFFVVVMIAPISLICRYHYSLISLAVIAIILMTMQVRCEKYENEKLVPAKADLTKIESRIYNYEIENYFSKFCKAVYDTEYADELKAMKLTNKSNKEIWQFCNEKLSGSLVYWEMKNDKELKELEKSLVIIRNKFDTIKSNYYKIFCFGTFGTCLLLLSLGIFIDYSRYKFRLRESEEENREKKIDKFLVKVNS